MKKTRKMMVNELLNSIGKGGPDKAISCISLSSNQSSPSRVTAGLAIATMLFVWCNSCYAKDSDPSTHNLILVTADGLRWQEVFGGADRSLLGPEKDAEFLEKFDRRSGELRRSALMPFFWKELAARGVIMGNRTLESKVAVKNPHKFSYPGYAEILLGEVLPGIDSNDPVYSPKETVLEFVRRALDLESTEVAVFASWGVFNQISVHREGSVFVSAGPELVPDHLLTEQMKAVNRLQMHLLVPWSSVRQDAVTVSLALDYMQKQRPRLLFVALDETDEWAHEGQYGMYLRSIRLFDDFLARLWRVIQAEKQYRDRTSIVISVDHGRGRSRSDWSDHGDVPGAEETWLAVVGPDTPHLGEVSSSKAVFQSEIAATMLTLLGLDYRDFNPEIGKPITEVLND
jgi:hypothetical protein